MPRRDDPIPDREMHKLAQSLIDLSDLAARDMVRWTHARHERLVGKVQAMLSLYERGAREWFDRGRTQPNLFHPFGEDQP